ncbi:hypothetical protein ONS95_008078 [Cadophora gregata]|uniref:uncharacterized protein n=1 Tax=Cadophora gregata TaxID=51156 RepID=UPI0026DD677C|nr:uncharacterized protein ONS95_008078 [Cadophora gregata]KAK0126481.1 hypothetical protein ONS95_008078 [Cadophora gregata]
MFCTSLRKRPEWATVPNVLLSSQKPRWREQSLTTHDLAIPVPNGDGPLDTFLFLTLSPSDTQPPASALARIQHLYHHTGGRNVGIVFLLNEKIAKGNGTIALMDLQVSIFSTLEMPIIPLFCLSTLQKTLSDFQFQLVQKRRTAVPSPIKSVISLLPYCTNNPPLPEHARNVVSDICYCLGDVARAATTADGQQGLKEWLDVTLPGAAQDIIDFWEEEIIVY